MPLAISADRLFTPEQEIPHPIVVISEGRIAAIGRRGEVALPGGIERRDFPGAVLLPGLFDVHIHGGAGHDLMQPDAAGRERFERHLFRQGVTAYLPTTMTAPVEPTLRALDHLAGAVEAAVEHHPSGRARPLGIHMEGPFISPAKPGVQPVEMMQPPSAPLFERFWEASRGRMRLITLAPELSGAEALIAAAAARGVTVSLGHCDADYDSVQRAIAAGARHVTHAFNAMRPLDHRAPGIVGAALGDDRLYAEIIADGLHLHPAVVRIFLRAKGVERAVLVTDAISATGQGDGRFRLGPIEVQVEGERCLYNGHLAGSVLALDRAVRNVIEFAGLDLNLAWRLASFNPARMLNLPGERGRLVSGAPAELVAATPAGHVLEVFGGS